MSDSDRHLLALGHLRSSPFASARDASGWLQISTATVRCDIDKLLDHGFARKAHGGVSAIDGAIAYGVFARTYAERSDVDVAARQAIAREAATMVRDGGAVIVHGGSPCFRLGRSSPSVISTSLPISCR